MQKIKIIHLIGDLTKGGAERFVVDLCNELAKDEQYDIHLVSICANDAEHTFIKEIDKSVRYLSFDKGRGFNLGVFLNLNKWLINEKPHVIHSHLNSFEYLALYLFVSRNTFFFHTIHNVAQEECPNFLIKAFRRLWYRMDKVKPVTISFDGSKSYRTYYRLDNDILIENGRRDLINTSEYNSLKAKYKCSDDFILVHVGRIAVEKNQELLIKAVKLFNATQRKKCRLLIIGEVKEEILYKRLIQLVDHDPQIVFVGGKHNVVDYLSIADAFCLSSLFEGMPISLIEALSVGCIPVCTPVGGIKQMISHGKTGFLTKNGSVEDYCATLIEALQHPDKKIISLNARLVFKLKYHIESSAKFHSIVYLERLETGAELKYYRISTKN